MKKILQILIFFLFAQGFEYSNAQNVRILLDDCSLEKEVLSEIEQALHFQLNFYTAIFNDSAKSEFKARIFGNKSDFVKYSKKVAGFNPTKDNTIAYYSPKLNEMIIPLELDNFVRTFKHELNHAIYSSFCDEPPEWIDEGLSEMFEHVVRIENRYEFEQILVGEISQVKKQILQGETIFDTFEIDAFDKADYNDHYHIACVVVWYLYATNQALLYEIIRESCGFNNLVINQKYPGGIASLNSDLKSFFFNISPPFE